MTRYLAMTVAILALMAGASFPAAASGGGGGGHGGGGHGGGGHGGGGHGGGGHGGYHGGGHSHSSFDFYLGGPLWYGPGPFYRPYAYPFGYPYYYEPPTVIIEREPPVYIQRTPAMTAPAPAQAQAAPSVWYYCPDPAGYYPYVPNCNQQWVNVDPRSVAPGPPPPR